MENVSYIFVIGGAAIYKDALQHPQLSKLGITFVHSTYPESNTVEQEIYFPIKLTSINHMEDLGALESCSSSNLILDSASGVYFKIVMYNVNTTIFTEMYNNLKLNFTTVNVEPNFYDPNHTVNKEEMQYVSLIKEILETGTVKSTRNGLTKSIFGYQMRFNLKNSFPLQTIKKSYPKSIFEELMWMIRGQTNVKFLQEKNVNVWNKNSSKEFLQKSNLPYTEGDIGPSYGFQMRHSGAEYIDCKTNYKEKGIDQLQYCINLIKNDPQSRRIIINLWNPSYLMKMALPPCHMIYHFSVDLYENQPNEPNQSNKPTNKVGKLNCHFFQRSWDILLGWNTTTAALFTCLLAHHCNLDPGVLVHSISDAHIYMTHIDSGGVTTLLGRKPRIFPTLTINKNTNSIEDYEFSDLTIKDYNPCPAIQLDMIA